jgi:hypothetical protein
MRVLFGRVIIWVICSFTASAVARADDGGPISGAPNLDPLIGECKENKGSLGFILRQDFTDISLFECPTADNLKKAVGSRLSLTFDELAHTTSISVDGLAAGALRYYGDGRQFEGVVLGPYVQGTGMYQFESPSAPSKTIDTVTAGGYAEFGFNDPLVHWQNYFRIRGGEVYGNSGMIGSDTVIGEWMPVYDTDTVHIGTSSYIKGTKIDYQFSPELLVEYDQLVYGPKKYLLFSTSNDALRIGPEGVLKLWVDSRRIGDQFLETIADRTIISITYHASWDTYSGRSYSWLQSVLTYNLDPGGHVALSAGYGYGNSETTANMTSQFKVGLAGKF